MRGAILSRHDANLTRGATDAHGHVLNAFAIVERERSRDDDGDDGGDADVLARIVARVVPLCEPRRLRGHLRERRRGAERFPAHDVVPQRRRVDVFREGHFESRARFLVRENRGADEPRVRFRDGAATRAASPTVNRRDTNCRDPSSRAHRTMACALVPWNANAETEASPGRFVSITEGIAANRRGAVARNGAEDPRTARTQRRLDVSIHFSQMRHRERRATNHRARRREKADRARGGLGVPDGALDGAEYERRGHGRRRGGQRLRAAAPISMGSPSAVPVPCI